jgi:hypothetical protein
MVLKEHRFTLAVNAETHVLRIEELVQGLALWPSRFRLKLPASLRSEAITIYGESCEDVAERAGRVIAAGFAWSKADKANSSGRGRPTPSLRILQIHE